MLFLDLMSRQTDDIGNPKNTKKNKFMTMSVYTLLLYINITKPVYDRMNTLVNSSNLIF